MLTGVRRSSKTQGCQWLAAVAIFRQSKLTVSMMNLIAPPVLVSPSATLPTLHAQGFAVLDTTCVCTLSGCQLPDLLALAPFWGHLPPDPHLKDGGRYRRRRHACFVVDNTAVAPVPHRPHWQPLAYNALHGGMHRLFEPVAPAMLAAPVWTQLLLWLGQVASALRGQQPWFVEAHPFRIDTTDGIGRPTPEGAHRDGVDLVAVFLVGRQGVKGGETRVFDADGPAGQRFTLIQPWSLLLLDDARVIHESTPIQPLQAGSQPAYRDTLVVTLRSGGFPGESDVGVT